jgi:hypothetical protein
VPTPGGLLGRGFLTVDHGISGELGGTKPMAALPSVVQPLG